MDAKGKLVHLFPKTQFTVGSILFFEHYFNMDEHVIILYTNKEFSLPQNIYEKSFVEDYDKENISWLKQVLIDAKGVVLHNLSVTFDIMNLLYFNPRIVKKAMWVIWGSDLHCYEEPRKKLADYYVEHMRKRIISNLACIGSLAEGDYQLAKKWYHTNAVNFRVEYCDENEFDIIKENCDKRGNDKTTLNILIGNSATVSNCHKEVLDTLSKFKEEDIHILMPLSYGDMDYAKEVKEYAKNIYQEKVEFLEKFLSRKEYFAILSKMDVAIFNNNRQQALGNIYALLYMKKKLYMRKNTAMWEEFVHNHDYQLESCDQLSQEDWSTFRHKDIQRIEHNWKLADDFYDFKKRAKEWENAFGELSSMNE